MRSNTLDEQIKAGIAREAAIKGTDVQTYLSDTLRNIRLGVYRTARDFSDAKRQAVEPAALPEGGGVNNNVQPRRDIMMNERQQPWLESLLDKLHRANPEIWETVNNLYQSHFDVDADGTRRNVRMTKVDASAFINMIKAHLGLMPGQVPVQVAPTAAPEPKTFDNYEDIPDGNYAIRTSPEAKNELAFYRVSTSKRTKRRKVQIRRGPNLDYIRWAQAQAIIDRIRLTTPKVAAERYAAELGHCYHCNLELTDDISRARGTGPVCDKNGHTFA